MAHITLQNVSVDIPVYNASGRSLKKQLMKIATGGQLGTNDSGCVIVRALENITFSFKNGDRVGLIGHNGAGKSTLLRVLSRVYTPTTGTALIQGNISSLIDVSLGLDPEFTGRENLYFRGQLLGLTKSEVSQKINDLIEFSELGNFFDMPLRTYSSGMLLRLGFAVSTILRPDILLMDEWLSIGDKDFIHKAEARLKDLIASTNILVIATHSRDLVLHNCNRVIWLEHGKIRMDGEPAVVVDACFGTS